MFYVYCGVSCIQKFRTLNLATSYIESYSKYYRTTIKHDGKIIAEYDPHKSSWLTYVKEDFESTTEEEVKDEP